MRRSDLTWGARRLLCSHTCTESLESIHECVQLVCHFWHRSPCAQLVDVAFHTALTFYGYFVCAKRGGLHTMDPEFSFSDMRGVIAEGVYPASLFITLASAWTTRVAYIPVSPQNGMNGATETPHSYSTQAGSENPPRRTEPPLLRHVLPSERYAPSCPPSCATTKISGRRLRFQRTPTQLSRTVDFDEESWTSEDDLPNSATASDETDDTILSPDSSPRVDRKPLPLFQTFSCNIPQSSLFLSMHIHTLVNICTLPVAFLVLRILVGATLLPGAALQPRVKSPCFYALSRAMSTQRPLRIALVGGGQLSCAQHFHQSPD